MTRLNNEEFIRSQIRRILSEKNDSENSPDESEDKKSKKSGGNTVLGGPGGGNYSEVMKAVFGGGKKADRLAERNPSKLMNNLNVSGVAGGDDQSRAEDLLSKAVGGTDAMSEAFNEPEEKKDSQGRWGFYIANKGLDKDRYAVLFVYDTVRGAVKSGTLKLDAKVKVEAAKGGALVYGVDSDRDKWDHSKSK